MRRGLDESRASVEGRREAAAAVALGSNIPPRKAALSQALELIGRLPFTRLARLSCVYETAPEGGAKQGGPYLNAAVLLFTALSPESLLRKLQAIETRMGRTEKGLGLPRTIDLDIVFYDRRRLQSAGLHIPHPRFRERGFVLQPLADIIPEFVDPVTNRTVAYLLQEWIKAGGDLAEGRPIESPAAEN